MTKTIQVYRFLHPILPNFDKYGRERVKLEKKSVFWLQEDEGNVQIHIRVKFNGSLTKTIQVYRFLHPILPNFDKYGRERVKLEKKISILASRG